MDFAELRTVIEARKRAVEALVPPPWERERSWAALHTEVVDADGMRHVANAKNSRTAQFIVMHDPASVIRQCQADLELIGVLSSEGITVSPVVLMPLLASLNARYETRHGSVPFVLVN